MVILELKEGDSTVTSEDSTVTNDNSDASLTAKSLAEDLVIEIISWLPVKNLCPFSCVSKPWLHLLTNDSYFRNLNQNHLTQSNPYPNLLALCKKPWLRPSNITLATDFLSCNNSIDLEVPFRVGELGSLTIHGIQNGLICLSCEGDDNIYIWNPYTKDYITIPCPPFILMLIPEYKKDKIYGFGYHQDTKDYKVVSVWSENNVTEFDFHSYVGVYTLGTDSWRLVDKDIPYLLILSKSSPLVNGAFNWLTFRSETLKECIIVAFDMKDDSFQQFIPPDEVKFGDRIMELGGLLCIYCVHDEKDVEIWAMQEYGVVKSWEKKYKIGVPQLVYGSFYNLEPVGFVAHSGEVIVKKNLTELILYDRKDNSVSEPKDLGFEFNVVYTFRGSILSPRCICNKAFHDIEETTTRER